MQEMKLDDSGIQTGKICLLRNYISGQKLDLFCFSRKSNRKRIFFDVLRSNSLARIPSEPLICRQTHRTRHLMVVIINGHGRLVGLIGKLL